MRGRRSKRGVDEAKLALLERHSSQMLATAHRYSVNAHDAEDAYQRAAEILLTHEPAGTDDDLCRWLRTTVKHEALAIRRRQERSLPAGAPERVPEPPAGQPGTHERAERFERLREGAQALGTLKPQEVRCLLLRAEGYSYQEICEETGFSYTKVNRCLAEGRRSFAARLAGIESGAECERLAPLLSALADGEATAADMATLRPHLRTCLACLAQLREYRATPSRVAALVPPAVLVASGHGGGPLRSLVESVVGATQERVAALGERTHQAAEMATGQKVAAVTAAAALATGGAAVQQVHERHAQAVAPPADVRTTTSEENAPPPAESAPAPKAQANPTATPTPALAKRPASVRHAPAPPTSPSNEFSPETQVAAPASRRAAPAPPPSSSGTFAPGGGGGAGGSEFSP
jgi:RNA polymerase sigma factor (sigma-70 family)